MVSCKRSNDRLKRSLINRDAKLASVLFDDDLVKVFPRPTEPAFNGAALDLEFLRNIFVRAVYKLVMKDHLLFMCQFLHTGPDNCRKLIVFGLTVGTMIDFS
jgi:hypothetical protein